MTATVWVVFTAVFAIAFLLLLLPGVRPSKEVQKRLHALEQTSAAVPDDNVTNIRREEGVTRIGWLNRWMTRFDVAAQLRLVLHQANMQTRTESLLTASLGGWAVVACLIYLRTRSLLPALLVAAAFLPAPLLYVLHRRAARMGKFEQQLPEALDMLVSALQVGHSLVSAIGTLGQECADPVGGEFRTLFDEQNFGVDLRTAMTNLATRVPLHDVRMFVAAALIQKESGGNLAEVLSKVAQTTRERFRLKKQISVHTAQGRLTGWVLSVLPVALGFGMYLVNPSGMSVLWTKPAGLKMLRAAIVMITLGSLIIRRIVRIRV